jgi:Holliday junction resolvasome RuvABC endonuclease subunit
MKVLALDPSLTATGWIVYDTHEHNIDAVGCYKVSVPRVQATKRTMLQQANYSEWLSNLVDENGIEMVFSEFPHGSQSSSAAWAMSMVSSVITAVCVCKDIPLSFFLESQAKKYLHGRSKQVTKEQTIQKVFDIYPKIMYLPGMNVQYKREAISDAAAILILGLASVKLS